MNLTRIRNSADVIDRVPLDHPPTSLVVARGTCSFESDDVDADIAVVMNEVIGYFKMGHVPIEGQRFALPGAQVVEYVAANNQVADRSLRRTISEQATGVTAPQSRPFLRRIGHDVMDDIVHNLDAGTRACDPDAARTCISLTGGKVPDLKSADGDEAAVS